MLFGHSNSLATLEEYINKILAKILDIVIMVYLDNILIYTEYSGQPYIKVMRWVLEKVWKYLVFVNLKKCCFVMP